jgi:purine-nucleoside phosphorylase
MHMSIHLGAELGDVARTILLPGDPLRAKHIAETMLEDSVCYSQVRGMYGYTGKFQDKRISVQGTGMGMPSISIYVHELIVDYQVKNLIRIGTCGAIHPDLGIGDVVLALGASTDSGANKLRFKGMDYAPTASFSLLKQAYDVAQQKGIRVMVGNILTSDTFYQDSPELREIWAKYGTLAVEMEAAALYTLAAKFGVNALAILTVSDARAKGQKASAEEREKSFTQMVEIALAIAE